MKKIFLFFIAGLLLSACSNSGSKSTSADQAPQNEIVITNDMENAMGVIPSWQNEYTVIAMKDPQAYSGDFACVTNDSIEFSYMYKELFKNLKDGTPKMVLYSGWVYTTMANPNFSVICNINADTLRYDWKAFPLDNQLSETGKWVEFSTSFEFDKPLKPEYEIGLVAWNQSKKPVFIDDLKITFYY